MDRNHSFFLRGNVNLFIIFVSMILLSSCEKFKWNLQVLPKFENVELSSNNQEKFHLSVSFDRNAKKTKYGFCFASHNNPSLDDEVIYLEPNQLTLSYERNWTSYQTKYVRAFASNSLGVSYSPNVVSIVWPANEDNIPQISLSGIDSISYFFTDAQAIITNDGNLPIVQRGFIFSTNANPTMSNSIVCNSPSLALNFENRNEGLSENTLYYVRAFVKNTYQTAISPEVLSLQTKNFYNVGELGPGGGKIFYTNLSGTTTWHFLEAAPTDFTSTLIWSNNNILINGVNTAIGTGFENTSVITLNQGSTGNYAALKAAQYVSGGLSDWFLPSRDEMIQLIQASNIEPIFNLDSGVEYWSSSQDQNFTQNAWVVKCISPSSSYTLNKLTAKKVRFIRRF